MLCCEGFKSINRFTSALSVNPVISKLKRCFGSKRRIKLACTIIRGAAQMYDSTAEMQMRTLYRTLHPIAYYFRHRSDQRHLL